MHGMGMVQNQFTIGSWTWEESCLTLPVWFGRKFGTFGSYPYRALKTLSVFYFIQITTDVSAAQHSVWSELKIWGRLAKMEIVKMLVILFIYMLNLFNLQNTGEPEKLGVLPLSSSKICLWNTLSVTHLVVRFGADDATETPHLSPELRVAVHRPLVQVIVVGWRTESRSLINIDLIKL